jgi:hypothetical protein
MYYATYREKAGRAPLPGSPGLARLVLSRPVRTAQRDAITLPPGAALPDGDADGPDVRSACTPSCAAQERWGFRKRKQNGEPLWGPP